MLGGLRGTALVASLLLLGLPATTVRAVDLHTELRQRAQAYADTMIQHGRDFEGLIRFPTSPMFASALTRAATPALLPDRRNTPPPRITGIREFDRALDGGNVFHDQQLFHLLYGLSDSTGNGSYKEKADAALTWFFNSTQSTATGLMPWGEHTGWDFRHEASYSQQDVDGDHIYETNMHEYFESWELWDKIYSFAATDAFQFAQGLWEHQMFDHSSTLHFSRHAKINEHQPESGNEFPRHGGYYIDAWSEAYSRSTDSTFQTAVDSMVQSFLDRLNQVTGALPMGTADGNDTAYEALNNLELAIQLDRSRPRMPPAQATKMQELSNSIDGIFLSLGHELGLGGRGFVLEADVGNLSSDIKWSSLWRSAYGLPTDAEMALFCFQRYKSLPSGNDRDDYRELCLDVAARYLNAVPDAPDAPSDPIGSWLLNESSGSSAADATGNGRTGTLAAFAVNPSPWRPSGGHTAGSLQFDGVDDKVIVSSMTTDGLASFTYSAWIFPTGAGSARVLSHEEVDKDEFLMGVTPTDDPEKLRVLARICNTASPIQSFETGSATELRLNNWHHFAVTYSDSGDRKLHLFLNGKEVDYIAPPLNSWARSSVAPIRS